MNFRFKGDISVYVLLMLGMTIGLYLFGFGSIAYHAVTEDTTGLGNTETNSFQTITEAIYNSIKDPTVLITLGVFSVASFFSLGKTGYTAGTIVSYLIPIFILFVVANIFFFPLETISTHGSGASYMADYIKPILTVVFNSMLFLAILEFASGRK